MHKMRHGRHMSKADRYSLLSILSPTPIQLPTDASIPSSITTLLHLHQPLLSIRSIITPNNSPPNPQPALNQTIKKAPTLLIGYEIPGLQTMGCKLFLQTLVLYIENDISELWLRRGIDVECFEDAGPRTIRSEGSDGVGMGGLWF